MKSLLPLRPVQTKPKGQSPDAQAGKRGHRLFDEFALNPANRRLFAVGYPGVLWAGGMDIPKTVTAGGNVRFEDERIKDGHADRFWAACAALEAAANCTDLNRTFAQAI